MESASLTSTLRRDRHRGSYQESGKFGGATRRAGVGRTEEEIASVDRSGGAGGNILSGDSSSGPLNHF